MPDSKIPPKAKLYLKYSTLGIELLASFLVPFLVGYWLNTGYLQTYEPWPLLIGLLFGVLRFSMILWALVQPNTHQNKANGRPKDPS